MPKPNNLPIPPLETETAKELMKRERPPVRMIVGDVIPAGLMLLAGDPKVGKSMLMQHLAVSVATGQEVWGEFSIDEGDVLYLAREGGDRSFRQRMSQMLGGEAAPDRLHIAYTSEELGSRLEFQLEMKLGEMDDPRLVVIDTYASVAPEIRGVNRHQEDYSALAGLADLTTRWPDTLVALVHHTNKSETDDVMHRISGSQGLTAATDGNAVLRRAVGSHQAILSIRPRNAEESEIVLEMNTTTLRFSVVGQDERSQLSAGRRMILEWLEANPEGGRPKAIAEALDLDGANVRQYLYQMANARQLVRAERGLYKLPAADANTSSAA